MPGVFKMATAVSQNQHGIEPNQVLLLLTQPLSKDLPARHTAAIRHLCADFVSGCPSSSLPAVTQVLLNVVHNVKADPTGSFVEPACALLRYSWHCNGR